MAIKDAYSFDRWPALREPARRVTASMQNAMRFMDTCKEYLLIMHSMPMTAQAVHEQAHSYGEMWDEFGDILHQRHLIQIFPATPELDEQPDADRVFEIIIACMDEIEDALGEFINACEAERLYPLARAAETLQVENSESYNKWLVAADMWETTRDKLSYEKWIAEYMEESEDD